MKEFEILVKMAMNDPCILVADSDRKFASLLATAIRNVQCFDVQCAVNGQEVLRFVEERNDIACIVLDYDLREYTGFQVAEYLSATAPHIPTILISNEVDQVRQKAMAVRVSFAPKSVERILAAIDRNALIGPPKVVDARIRGALASMGFVFESKSMARVMVDLVNAAKSERNLLVVGETGVGKTTVARIIHDLSRRSENPFEVFECPKYSENAELFVAELFGYSINPVTGKSGDQTGILEMAGRGTVLLDEVNDIPASAQAILLSALGQKKYRRPGDTDLRSILARIISTASRDINGEDYASVLRRDLLQRLRQEVIVIPPLRERPEDIEVLAPIFLKKFAMQPQGRQLFIHDDAIRYLQRQAWPGNISQLNNILARVVQSVRSDTIYTVDVARELYKDSPLKTATEKSGPPFTAAAPVAIGADVMRPTGIATGRSILIEDFVQNVFEYEHATNLKDLVEEVRRELIQRSLSKTKGNVYKAERDLWGYPATSNGSLRHQIKKFGIDPKKFS